MKIGYDAKRLFANFTGLGNYSRALVKNYAKHYPQDSLTLFNKHCGNATEVVEFTSEPYSIKTPNKNSPLWRQHGICKDIKSQKIDIFHGLSHELPFGIEKCGVGSVVTMHDVCYKTFPKMFSPVERFIYSVKYRNACHHSNKIIAISQSTRNDLLRYFDVDPGKVEVLYQAINPQFYSTISSHTARTTISKFGITGDYMLYVGSINSRKNLLGIIEAMAQLSSCHRVPLVVIGRGGEYKEKCIREATKLDVLRRIKFIDNVQDMATLQAFYSEALVMLYPSYYEGFGLPVTEAILSCCPVVTSCVSSLPEAGGKAALYVDPNSSEELTAAIERTLDMNAIERKALTDMGREEALLKFNPESLSTQLHQLYKTIL